MMDNNTRKFDGMVYKRGSSFGEKRVANRVAAKYRARGEKIRTTRSKNPNADITGIGTYTQFGAGNDEW